MEIILRPKQSGGGLPQSRTLARFLVTPNCVKRLGKRQPLALLNNNQLKKQSSGFVTLFLGF